MVPELSARNRTYGLVRALEYLYKGGKFGAAKKLENILSNRTGIKNIPISDLPSAILVHAGPGVLGASFFVAEP